MKCLHKGNCIEKNKQMFPPSKQNEETEFLDLYGEENPDEIRVQRAILKISKGRLNQFRYEVNIIKPDYRDVLTSARFSPNDVMAEMGEKAGSRKIPYTGIRTHNNILIGSMMKIKSVTLVNQKNFHVKAKQKCLMVLLRNVGSTCWNI